MTGDLTINGYDAYTRWGVNLEDGAVSALLAPAPMKENIQNKSRLKHGKASLNNNPKSDARELSLPFHVVADTKAHFFEKYAAFCSEVLANRRFTLQSVYIPNTVYTLDYVSCNQFGQYNQEMAKFVLKVEEPDPTNRTVSAT